MARKKWEKGDVGRSLLGVYHQIDRRYTLIHWALTIAANKLNFIEFEIRSPESKWKVSLGGDFGTVRSCYQNTSFSALFSIMHL